MNECDAVKMQNHDRGNGRRTGRAAVGLVSHQPKGLGAALVVVLAAIIFVSPAPAQLADKPLCETGRPLIEIPEVKSENGKLRAVLMLSDEKRAVGGWGTGERCIWQHLRYFKGWNAAVDPPPAWPSNQEPLPKGEFPGEPIPGPTLRARIGDLIQISFLNQIDTKNFPFSLDVEVKNKTTKLEKGAGGMAGACDEAFGTAKDSQGNTIKVNIYPRNNKMPNCLHGSSTANVHFHGTHTTPGTTGDNVLLFIRPALRDNGQIKPTDAEVKTAFGKIFKSCEANGSPTGWDKLPPEWQKKQEELLQEYDKNAPYKGEPGKLPPELKLWPKNKEAIKEGKWPQYSIGAFPYCFRLPDYDAATPKVNMGQAPGTHWYHAHKHGSTALNVANGMLGAFIIEGPYDDTLRAFYKKTPGGLEEKVLVIQQLETSLNMLSVGVPGVTLKVAPLSVNGRRQPVITMRPGQVQLWRIVNGAPRTFVQFLNVVPQAATLPAGSSPTPPCSNTNEPCVDWRQTAQDGVQFHPDNYEKIGRKNAQFNMAGGNRVDLLVKAPETAGSYALEVVESVVTNPDPKGEHPPGLGIKTTLLTVNVTGEAIKPPMEFIDKGSFPPFPEFLEDIDIPASPVARERTLTFDTKGRSGSLEKNDLSLPSHTINGELFNNKIEQHMLLNSVEEWTVFNKTTVSGGIAHPFHIHINPFQVVEVFDPTSAEASDKNNKECYADPKDPKTWKLRPSCNKLTPPFVWWDVRAIPAARNWEWVEDPNTRGRVDCSKNDKTNQDECPPELKAAGASCRFNETAGKQQCTVPSGVVIPGYFKMRSRFVDFPGVFVQHCHILAHEDLGMMQLIEVYPKERGPTKEIIGFTHY